MIGYKKYSEVFLKMKSREMKAINNYSISQRIVYYFLINKLFVISHVIINTY